MQECQSESIREGGGDALFLRVNAYLQINSQLVYIFL